MNNEILERLKKELEATYKASVYTSENSRGYRMDIHFDYSFKYVRYFHWNDIDIGMGYEWLISFLKSDIERAFIKHIKRDGM